MLDILEQDLRYHGKGFRNMKNICLILIAFFQLNFALGSESIKEWYAQSLTAKKVQSELLGHLVVIDDIDKKGTISAINFDALSFNNEGVIPALSTVDVDWSLKLNSHAGEAKNIPDLKKTLVSIFKDQRISMVLVNNKSKKQWELYSKKDPTSEVQMILSADALEILDANNLKIWFGKNLGYQGIALDYKNGNLLTLNLMKNFKSARMQALAISDSENQFILKSDSKGGGLFKLETSEGPYAIFKVLLLEKGGQDIKPGTKLIFETVE